MARPILLAGLLLGAASAAQLEKRGCGRLKMHSRFLKVKAKTTNPGAGMDAGVAPFEESYNDGFAMIDCVQDYMHVHGDKHGDGKFAYKLADIANVSILHYSDLVPSEDAEGMTHEVCFGFCRTIPDMRFFGITNGRDCYCAPYYKQMAGDSSECDAPCDGDSTKMCGGKTKSSVFSMHACNDHEVNFQKAKSTMGDVKVELEEFNGKVTDAWESMQDVADAIQPSYSKVGDSAASGILQDAKVFAGKLQASAEAGVKLADELKTLEGDADGHDLAGNVLDTEKMTADLGAMTGKAKEHLKELKAFEKEALTPEAKDALKLYYPLMFFVDKEFEEAPTTCAGDMAAQPLVGDVGGCAEACEALGEGCVAFSFIQGENNGICGLFTKVKTATYYTGCGEGSASAAFLQKSSGARAEDPSGTKCMVRFSDFRGMTLKPDPSGKCKACLKEAKQADRCPAFFAHG